jgi:hypothetical protein
MMLQSDYIYRSYGHSSLLIPYSVCTRSQGGRSEQGGDLERKQPGMSKRPCIESHGDEPERLGGGHRLSKEPDMSNRPSLSEFGMSKLPLIGRCTGRTPRQHLYLVVDDWERLREATTSTGSVRMTSTRTPTLSCTPAPSIARSFASRPSTRTRGHSPPTAARSW